MIFMAFESDGTREKFEYIYTQYHRTVFERAFSLLHDHHDAEDAAQETWCAVAKNMDAISEKDASGLRATLLAIVKYKAIDIFRRRSQYDSITVDLEVADWEPEVDDRVFTEFCEKESVTHILRCIKELDERYTDVLRLYYLQENTTREIAKLLSLNVKTVETRLSRGRALLYQKMKESGMD